MGSHLMEVGLYDIIIINWAVINMLELVLNY